MKKKSHSKINKQKQKKYKLSPKAGLPPGTIVHVGKEYLAEISMSAIFYNAEVVEQKELHDIADCAEYLQKEGITWINVVGVHHAPTIEAIGAYFNLHPLVMEDIANTQQRPKFEEFKEYIFFTLKDLEYNTTLKEIEYEQISIVLGQQVVISFQEKENPLFDDIRDRLLNGISRGRSRDADYLVSRLIDATVDSYYDVIEHIEDHIEVVEDDVLNNGGNEALVQIQKIKRDIVALLKTIFPLREAINNIQRCENKLITDPSRIFFSSIYDHVVHVIESVESQREILSGLMDIYLTNINNRMNSVMKVLTVIATIFMPISFFAAVYGMNFKLIPELQWTWGYAFFWMICFFSIVIMLIIFKKKRWF